MSTKHTTSSDETPTEDMRAHARKVIAEHERQTEALGPDAAAVDLAADTAAFSDVALDMALDGQEIRLDQGIAMRHFFPGGDSQAYALKHVCPNGKGAREVIGALVGIVARTEDGTSDLGPYIRAVGEFYMESKLTGERRYHTDCFLPQGYAKQLKALISAGGENIKLDTVVCIEATGKGVPFGYVILSRLAVQPTSALREMLASRSKRLTATAVPTAIAG